MFPQHIKTELAGRYTSAAHWLRQNTAFGSSIAPSLIPRPCAALTANPEMDAENASNAIKSAMRLRQLVSIAPSRTDPVHTA